MSCIAKDVDGDKAFFRMYCEDQCFSLCIRMPFILTLQRQLLQEKFHALQKSDLDHVLVQQITIFFILC